MKTNHVILMALVSLAAATAPQLMADTVVLYQDAYSAPNGAGSASGGEFSAITLPTSYLADYSPLALFNAGGGFGFDTFCVEVGVDFYPGVTYGYTLGQSLSSPAIPLTEGAAYLYYEFATGKLNYDYLNTPASGPGGTDRIQDAGLLQAAIWEFEGGQIWSGDPFTTGNYYYQLALGEFGGSLAAADAASAGAYGVDVLQLWNPPGSDVPAQDQLVYVPVPDGGSTVLMLGMGFSLLSLVGLRYRKLPVY